MRILIFEDNNKFVKDLRTRLETFKDVKVVATFRRADNVQHRVELHKPDLILMDISLLGQITGIDATTLLKSGESTRHIPIVMLTSYDDAAKITAAFKAGANGYILKGASSNEYLTQIEAFQNSNDELLIDKIVQKKLVEIAKTQLTGEAAPETISLTQRQKQLLCLLNAGLKPEEIGTELNITTYTVNTHLRNIYKELSEIFKTTVNQNKACLIARKYNICSEIKK